MTWNRITSRGSLHPYRKKEGSRLSPNRHSPTRSGPLDGKPIRGRPEQQAGQWIHPQRSSPPGQMPQ